FHARIRDHALKEGLAIYPTGGTIDGNRGDHLIVAPPYISQPHHIEMIVDRLGRAIDSAVLEWRDSASDG
ncbi:MAG: aspartate aminotransferase family protein, partial [Gammaproteobacteria bacterium]